MKERCNCLKPRMVSFFPTPDDYYEIYPWLSGYIDMAMFGNFGYLYLNSMCFWLHHNLIPNKSGRRKNIEPPKSMMSSKYKIENWSNQKV